MPRAAKIPGSDLTPKQKKFTEEYHQNIVDKVKSPRIEAAFDSYEITGEREEKRARSVASRVADKALSYPAVRREIKKLQRKVGITDEYLAEKLKDGLEAEKPYYDKAQKKTARLKDTTEQRKHLELAHRLRGDMDERKTVSKRELTMKMTAEMSMEELMGEVEDLSSQAEELAKEVDE